MFDYLSKPKKRLLLRWLTALRASWRDTKLLFRQFRVPLFVFLATVMGGGLAYHLLSNALGEPTDDLVSATYLVLTMVFLQPFGEFPHHPLLQIFYFVLPVIGLSALAQGLAEFGILLFNRRARSKEWEMSVAATFSNHTILVGLGHLGYRVVNHLHQIDEAVVVIELNPSSDQIGAVQKMGIPVIQDDASRPAILEAAGVARARTIALHPERRPQLANCPQSAQPKPEHSRCHPHLRPGLRPIATAAIRLYRFERHSHGRPGFRSGSSWCGHHQPDYRGRKTAQPSAIKGESIF